MPKNITKMRDDAEDIKNISKMYFTAADEARKPIEQEWDKYWRIYRNQYDFSKKSAWQSASYLSKLPQAIGMTASILAKPVRLNSDLFTVDTNIPRMKQYRAPVKSLIDYWWDYNKFRQTLFKDALVAGLLQNLLIFKVVPRLVTNKNNKTAMAIPSHDSKYDIIKQGKGMTDEQMMVESMLASEHPESVGDMYIPKTEDRVCVEILAINPYDFRIDVSGRTRYVIQDIWYDLDEFKANSKKMGYNQNMIDHIEGSYKKPSEYKESVRFGTAPGKTMNEKQVLVQEYHGDLYTEKGDLIQQNCTWTMANNQYLVREPIENQNWHEKIPFVWGAPKRIPFSTYHKSYCEDVYGLAKSLTDLFNLLVDTNSYAMAKAFELDIDMVYDPEQIKSGVYPGKTFFKRSSGNPNTRMLQDVSLGNINPQALRIYQTMDMEFINASGLGSGTGTSSSKTKPTAREVEARSEISNTIMEDMAYDIESGVISPLCDLVYKTALQYQNDFSDPSMAGLSQEARQELAAFSYLPKEMKMEYMDAFSFKVDGISSILRKQKEMQKLLQVFALGAQAGEMGQQILGRIDTQWAVETLMSGIQIDTTKAFKPEQQYQQEMQQKAQMAQAQMAQQMQIKQQEAALKGHDSQAKLQIEQAKAQTQIQTQTQKGQLELKTAQQKHLLEMQMKAQEHQQNMRIKAQEHVVNLATKSQNKGAE